MPDPNLVDMDDGYGWHIESSVAGVTLCGRQITGPNLIWATRDIVNRVHDHTGDKPGYCFDCLSVRSGGEVSDVRRERHFS